MHGHPIFPQIKGAPSGQGGVNSLITVRVVVSTIVILRNRSSVRSGGFGDPDSVPSGVRRWKDQASGLFTRGSVGTGPGVVTVVGDDVTSRVEVSDGVEVADGVIGDLGSTVADGREGVEVAVAVGSLEVTDGVA